MFNSVRDLTRRAWPVLLVGLVIGCGGDKTGPTLTQLTITAGGAGGTGLVTSNPAGISCTVNGGTVSGTCTAGFTAGTVVTLSSSASGGSTFGSWTGACGASANAPTCAINLTVDLSVAATFLAPGGIFSGFFAIGNAPNQTGILVVSIPTAVFSIWRQPTGPRPTFTSPPLLASGTLRLIGDATIVSVVGTYNATADGNELCLVQTPPGAADPCSPPAGAWAITGFFSDSLVTGVFDGPAGSGTIRLLGSQSQTPPTLYCGTLTVTAGGSPGASTTGPIDLAVIGAKITGQAAVEGNQLTLDGELAFGSVSVTGSDGFFFASGDLSGTNLSGTWNDQNFNSQGPSGTWTASTSCQ